MATCAQVSLGGGAGGLVKGLVRLRIRVSRGVRGEEPEPHLDAQAAARRMFPDGRGFVSAYSASLGVPKRPFSGGAGPPPFLAA